MSLWSDGYTKHATVWRCKQDYVLIRLYKHPHGAFSLREANWVAVSRGQQGLFWTSQCFVIKRPLPAPQHLSYGLYSMCLCFRQMFGREHLCTGTCTVYLCRLWCFRCNPGDTFKETWKASIKYSSTISGSNTVRHLSSSCWREVTV